MVPPPANDELALEAEFDTIQAGRLTLDKAPTFNKIAAETNQSVHQVNCLA